MTLYYLIIMNHLPHLDITLNFFPVLAGWTLLVHSELLSQLNLTFQILIIPDQMYSIGTILSHKPLLHSLFIWQYCEIAV